MNVNIISDTNRKIPRTRIKSLIGLIDDDEEPPLSSINIVFVRDYKIKKLNNQFRQYDKPTDVLSFNLDDEPGEENIFGEIYISTDMAQKNADLYNGGFYNEIVRLCCHGYLHLLGYDHEKENDKKIMQGKEKYYLGKI